MNRGRNIRVIISGGGTGGHVFPAISVANALRKKEPSIEILFVGAEGRMEMEEVPKAGYHIKGLPVEGIDRKNIIRNIMLPCRLMKSLRMAGKIIGEYNPDVVVGVGGYASGPVLRKAGQMGIPTLIQEQNSYAGVTNRLLAPKASVICVAYDGMNKFFPAGKIIKTGNPVRADFRNLDSLRQEALEYFQLAGDMPVILVLGGSLGAGSINRSLSENIGKIAGSQCQWLWQTGKNYHSEVSEIMAGSTAANISLRGFINRMDLAYAAADVVISRSGAVTISELCLAGKPVILVPSPNVAEDHQTRNAMIMSEKGAAILVRDDQVMGKLVDEAIALASDKSRQKMLANNISGMAEPDAGLRIAEEVIKLARR